jgi:hypothetical protein
MHDTYSLAIPVGSGSRSNTPPVLRGRHPLARHKLFAGLCAALLCGCADVSMPEYRTPDAPMKSSWSQPAGTVSAADAITPDWWKEFRDPYLAATST